jgi:hypothetical protein
MKLVDVESALHVRNQAVRPIFTCARAKAVEPLFVRTITTLA